MGIGHNWVKNRFVLATKYGKQKITDDKSGKNVEFIPATVYDNEALMKSDPTYARRLEALPEDKKKAFLYGDWDSFEGMAFPMWNPRYHVVKSFPIPKHWRRWISVDNGYSDPFDWLWYAVDEEGTVHVYREYTREREDMQVIYSKQAFNIRERSGRLNEFGEYEEEKIDYIVAGHDAMMKMSYTKTSDNPEGKSLVEFYEDGFKEYLVANNLEGKVKNNFSTFITAVTDRKLGKAVCLEYLTPEFKGIYDEDGLKIKMPKVVIHDCCRKLIKYLPQQVDDPDDGEKVADLDIGHWYDSFRYGLISHHIEKSKAVVVKSDIEQMKDKAVKKLKSRRRSRFNNF